MVRRILMTFPNRPTRRPHDLAICGCWELNKLQVLSREAWDGWQRSQDPAKTVRVIQKNGEKRAENTVRERSGNPAFLRILLGVNERHCKLLGVDATANAADERLKEEEIHKKATAMLWDWVASPPKPIDDSIIIERRIAEGIEEIEG